VLAGDALSMLSRHVSEESAQTEHARSNLQSNGNNRDVSSELADYIKQLHSPHFTNLARMACIILCKTLAQELDARMRDQ
jgi:hypothetical protein